MTYDDFIKTCENCGAHLPMKANACEFCNFQFIERVLTDEELNIPFKEIIKNINSAFFKLESFMNGLTVNYRSFDFKGQFDLFFALAKLSENFSPDTSSLVDDYWNLTEQLRYDTDKGNFENSDAYENEDFCQDINAILQINDSSHKFLEFSTESELSAQEKKFSVTDIIAKTNNHYSLNPQGEVSVNVFHKMINLLLFFERLEFVFEQHQEIQINLNKHSLKLYNDIDDLKKSVKYFHLTAGQEAFNQFCEKAIRELENIKSDLTIPEKFGIVMAFRKKEYTIEPDTLDSYISISVTYIQELIEFIGRYLKPRNQGDDENQTNAAKELTDKLSLRHVAMIHCYKNNPITKGDIANGLAKRYGYNSGDKLYQYFSFYSDRRHRVKLVEGSKIETTLKTKINLLEDIINLGILNAKESVQACDELNLLKSNLH